MVYIINILLILFWNSVISDEYKDKKKFLCCLYCLQWVFLSGFRGYYVGADTYSYRESYLERISYSWGDIFSNIYKYILDSSYTKDPGYKLFEKICQIWCGNNYTLFLITVACVFTIPMSIWIYKYSDNPCLSFVIYSTLFYSFFAITGIRQTVATSIVVFGGFECMKKDNIPRLILLNIIAYFIHKSAICFIVTYLVKYVKINRTYWITMSIAIVLSFIFRKQLVNFLGGFVGYEYDNEYSKGVTRVIYIYIALYIIILLFYKNIEDNYVNRFCIFSVSLSVFFIPFMLMNPSYMRVIQYYSLFMMLLIPKIISGYDGKTAMLANAFCYMFLTAYLVSCNPTYTFIFFS